MRTIQKRLMYRSDREKTDGTFPVVLRITIRRKVKYFPLKFSVKPKDWNEKKGMVYASDPDSELKNKYITKALAKVASIEEHTIKFGDVDLDEFSRLYFFDNYNPDSFYAFIDYLVERKKNELAESTIDFYYKQKSKLKEFRETLNFGDINLQFLNDYKSFLIQKGNKPITWAKSLEFVRRILNAALKDNRIPKSPFAHFEISSYKGTIEPLEVKELKLLEELFEKNTLTYGKQNALRVFLFACYTGLRWSDVYALKFKEIIQGHNFQYLNFTQIKTKKETIVPLIPQALNLIPNKEFENQKVFRVPPNQTTNRHLREIIKGAKINKRITFHSSRHTFSHIMRGAEIPMEIRARIIGDNPETVRKHYTDIKPEELFKELAKYAAKLNE